MFAEHHFKDQIPGECFRRSKSGGILKNDWVLFPLRDLLTESCMNQDTVTSYDSALSYATETLARLEMMQCNDGNREFLSHNIYKANKHLGHILMYMMRHEEALHPLQGALAAARYGKLEDNGGTSNLYHALMSMALISGILKTGETIKYAEEAYNLVSGQHGPEHPSVQGAATCLIDSCLEMGNFVDAERFARINYECLTDPSRNIDRKDPLYVYAKIQLARVWSDSPPDQRLGGPEAAEEAERLAREACEMTENSPRCEHSEDPVTLGLSTFYGVLARVMIARGKPNRDIEKVLTRALSLTRDFKAGEVPTSSYNRCDLLRRLGEIYYALSIERQPDNIDHGLLEKAIRSYEESLLILTALFSPNDERTIDLTSRIRYLNKLLSQSKLLPQNQALTGKERREK